MKGRWLLLLVMLASISMTPAALARDESQPRLLVLTDISSLTTGVAEPDDGQSLIRLMLYANEFNIEGLIATSNLGHGQKTRPDLIRQVVDAYEKVRPNLVRHDPRYPAAEVLRGGIKAGQERRWSEGAGRWNRSVRGRTPKLQNGSCGSWTDQIPAPSGWSSGEVQPTSPKPSGGFVGTGRQRNSAASYPSSVSTPSAIRTRRVRGSESSSQDCS